MTTTSTTTTAAIAAASTTQFNRRQARVRARTNSQYTGARAHEQAGHRHARAQCKLHKHHKKTMSKPNTSHAMPIPAETMPLCSTSLRLLPDLSLIFPSIIISTRATTHMN